MTPVGIAATSGSRAYRLIRYAAANFEEEASLRTKWIAASAALMVSIGVAGQSVIGVGSSSAASQGCIQAGLEPPTTMRTHFQLEDDGPSHKDITNPLVEYHIRFPALPESCDGKAIQVQEVKVRYKTSKLGEKTLTVENRGKHVQWAKLYVGRLGSGGYPGSPPPPSGELWEVQCYDNGYFYPFGTVEKVTALERLNVKEVGTGKVLGTRTRSIPVQFDRARQPGTAHSGC
jgi:hypothetical protein